MTDRPKPGLTRRQAIHAASAGALGLTALRAAPVAAMVAGSPPEESDVLRLEHFGGAGDAVIVADGVIAAGSNVLRSPSAPFTAEMVGRTCVVGGGSSGGTRLLATVVHVDSPSQLRLSELATETQTSTGVMVGTDNTAALQAALDAAAAPSPSAAPRHIQIGAGKYLLTGATTKNFLQSVETVTMSGTGRSSELLIGGTPSSDMLTVQNLDQFVFENLLIVGLFNQLVDCSSVVYGQYVRQMTVRNVWWYLVGSGGGAPASGLIHAYECDLRVEDLIFHACSGVEVHNGCVIFVRNWQGFLGRRLQFIDFGNYEGNLVTSSVCRAWIRAQDPHAVGGADGQGTFTLEHFRMDEGTQHSVELVPSATRTESVLLRDGTVFAGLTPSYAALEVASTGKVEIDAVKIGFRSGPTSDAVKLTDAGNVTIRGSRFAAPVDRITVDERTKHLHLEDTVHGTVVGRPKHVTESRDGTERRAPAESPRLLSFLPTVIRPNSDTGWGRVTSGVMVGGASLDSSGAQGAQATWDEIVLGAGTWTMELLFRGHTNRGTVSVALDDGEGRYTEHGTIDLYTPRDEPNARGAVAGIAIGESIRRSLRLTMDAKNAASAGYYGSIQAISFRRTS